MLKGRICNACKQEIQRDMLDRNHSICPRCGYYMRMHARKRILSLADKKSFREWDANMELSNPLNDSEYAQKSVETSAKHKLNDAIITGEIYINASPVAIGVMDTRYMMASMGYVVGEKVTRLFEKATKKKMPVIMFCCSGGARMQEGMIALMQMEKTAAAVKRHGEKGLLFISILTNPTMGGVTASFAMLADVVLAEKGAMIGFAGPRVIEQNTGKKLPEGFQTAEFQKEHGFIDAILERENERKVLGLLVKQHLKKSRKNKLFKLDKQHKFNERLEHVQDEKLNNGVTAWERVQNARRIDRPTSLDYINNLFEDFYELSGDRVSGDDHAIVGGIVTFYDRTLTVIGNQKGKDSLNDALYRNWGMASPQGYRKALRLAKQAEKFRRPIIFFIDTIGAACGETAEEGGQGLAIANLLQEMSTIKVPVLSIIIGEGGSGGALALGVANEVWMLENSIYSILTPEGYASIIWKDSNKAKDAAEIMDIDAEKLNRLKVVDYVVKEEEPVTKENMSHVCDKLRDKMIDFLEKYGKKSERCIVSERYNKFRSY